MVRRYLASLLLLATPALAAVELDGDSNGAIDVSKGGTNATTAAGARTALGVPATAATLVGDCTVGPCFDGSADGGNYLKFWDGTGSYWTALQGGAPDANRSWRLPIAAAPAAGETLVMTMDQYGQMGFLSAPETSGYVLSSTDAGVLSWAAGSGDGLGSAAYSDVVALWTTCTGYLKSDGTCDTPSGSATYPSAAGVANWGGSAWGTSYTVGIAANNLVQLNASAQLPAVSADLLTITDTGTYFTTDTVGAALQELGSELADVTEITIGTGLTDTNGTLSVTYPVTSAAYGSGWSDDTDGAQRDDIYAILHAGDTDDDGRADVLDLDSAGYVKVNSSGVISSVKEKEYIGWSVVNSDTATAVADGKLGAAIPAGMNGMNLTDVTCSVAALNAAASGATTAVVRRVRLGSRMGDDTSQFDLTFSTPNVTVTWDSTGTDPGISTSTLAAGDEVDVSGFATAANNGHFTVATVGANYFTFANASGVENLDDVGVTITPIRHRDMTSTGVTIEYGDYTASDEVIDTSNDDLATGDKLYVDIPTSGVTIPAQKGLHCTATFETP